jgi:uncharacterized protein YukE
VNGFEVNTDALRGYGMFADGRAEALRSRLQDLDQAQIGRDAFGHIPGIGARIYDAYDQHIDNIGRALTETIGLVGQIQKSIDDCADLYEGIDKDLADAFKLIMAGQQ